MRRETRISTPYLPAIALLLSLAGGALAGPLAAQFPTADPPYLPGFPTTIVGTAARTINIADVTGDGLPELVFGSADGRVHVYDQNGSEVWRTPPTPMGLSGKPAVGDVDGDGFVEVVFGTGSTLTPNTDGALYVYSHTGVLQCDFTPRFGPNNGAAGIFASPAIADLDGNDNGRLEIVFGTWDSWVYSLHHDCSLHWEFQVRDTVFSSAAIGDLDRDGDLDVVVGADSHQEGPPHNSDFGGRLWAFEGQSNAVLPGFPVQFDEVLHSSPALGDIDGDGFLDIVIGTGNCYGQNNGCGLVFNPGVGEYVIAVDRFGNDLPGWPVITPGKIARSSPALADLDQDGRLEVVINMIERDQPASQSGSVYAIDGDGSILPGWPVEPSTPANCAGATVGFGTDASPVVGRLDGDLDYEIILPSNSELVVWDAAGNQLTRQSLAGGCTVQPPGAWQLVTNSTVTGMAAVGDIDSDGDVEVAVGGWSSSSQTTGAVYVWDFPGTLAAGDWPQFRQNQRNLGVASSVFSDGFESGDTSGWSGAVGN